MAIHEATGNSTWLDWPDQTTPITAARLEAIENALDLALTRPFIRQQSAAATAFTFTTTRQRIPFATAVDVHADVTVTGGGTVFQVNRAGVWRCEAGVRLSASTASQTKYLNISDSTNLLTGGFGEAQELRTSSGGALTVSSTRRFAAGATVCATLLVLGNGTATIAADIPADTFFTLTWQRA